jgi:hypothetical protein
MSFIIPTAVLAATKHKEFANIRERVQKDIAGAIDGREYELDLNEFSDVVLTDLSTAAESVKHGRTVRATQAIIAARAGDTGLKVPNFAAFLGMLTPFLRKDAMDGWIYIRQDDGRVYPELVTEVRHNEASRYQRDPSVSIHTTHFGYNRSEGGMKTCQSRHSFTPADVANKALSDVLMARNIYHETPALRKTYDEEMKRYRKVVAPAFGRQFRLNGLPAYEESGSSTSPYTGLPLVGRKVINDLNLSEAGALQLDCESSLFEEREDGCPVPVHPSVRVFDLEKHAFLWVHGDTLTPYVYDKSLRNKLILPKLHRDLLDVLTTDLDAFTADIIEGKSAGNIVLAKGESGLGKTLTAEVYAEIREIPLYKIRSGELGTTAEVVEGNLQEIFTRAKRWNCLLLMDEAEVFVSQRTPGGNLERNAIVAEFLRVLEHIDILFFMATNLPKEIDPAIISRCAAILDYQYPDAESLARVWHVMADLNGIKLSDKLVKELVVMMPHIAPRDVKNLFRLTLRMNKTRIHKLVGADFRRCAMLRGVEFSATLVA